MEEMKDRFRKLRKHLDLTQSEFAQRIGSVQNTITGYESGRRMPSGQVISLICKTFNVNEDWLRNGTGDMFIELSRDEQIEQFIGDLLKDESDTFRRRLISALAALDDDGWLQMEKLVDSIVAENKENKKG